MSVLSFEQSAAWLAEDIKFKNIKNYDKFVLDILLYSARFDRRKNANYQFKGNYSLILAHRYGFTDGIAKTWKEVGLAMGVCSHNCRIKTERLLQKLRFTKHSFLKEYQRCE